MLYACWFLWRVDYIEDSSDIVIFNLGLRFEGFFWEGYILKSQITFEGHWRLQSWTLVEILVFSISIGYMLTTFGSFIID